MLHTKQASDLLQYLFPTLAEDTVNMITVLLQILHVNTHNYCKGT